MFTEFGLTKDYFKIGKIGSNTTNFINFTTKDRKDYISKFLPDIEDYDIAFKTVKDKHKSSAADIKTVSADLIKFDEEEGLIAKVASYKSVLSSLETSITTLTGDTAVLKSVCAIMVRIMIAPVKST